MAHREGIREYLKDVRLKGLVVDWGCGTKPINNYLASDPLFDYKFFGIDKLAHVGADLVANLCQPIFLKEKADMAFCLEVLEHVKEPTKVLENIYNNLKQGCPFYFSVPFLYPVHSEEDYWRFTDQGLRLLLEDAGFEVIEILPTENNAGWVGKAIKK